MDGNKLMLHEIATYLHDNISIIKKHPAAFGGVALFTAIVTFEASTWYYQQRVEYLKDHIDSLLRVSKTDISQIQNEILNSASDDSNYLKPYDTILLAATTSQEDDKTYLVERPVYIIYDKLPSEVYITISGEDITDVWVEDFSNNQTITTSTVHKSRDEVKISIRHPTNIYSIYVRTASPSSIEYEFDFNIN